jgi:hypothetical protein
MNRRDNTTKSTVQIHISKLKIMYTTTTVFNTWLHNCLQSFDVLENSIVKTVLPKDGAEKHKNMSE